MGSIWNKVILTIFVMTILCGNLYCHAQQVDRSTETRQNIRILVLTRQSYEGVSNVKLPYSETAERMLEDYGFLVITDPEEEYDAVLKIDASGTPLTGRYLGGSQYSGAKVQGEITLEICQSAIYYQAFRGEFSPPDVILRKYRSPEKAPFDKAFLESDYILSLHVISYFLGVERSISMIAKTLKSRRAFQRCRAAEILGELKETQGVRSLIKALDDRNPNVRNHVVKALGKIGDDSAVMPLIERLEDKNPDVCQGAVWALGEIGDPIAVFPLINALKSNLYVQSNAVSALGKIGIIAIEPLVSILNEKDMDTLVKETVVNALGKIEETKSAYALINVLGNEDHWLRRKAINALSAMGITALQPLIDALKYPSSLVRRGAAEALGIMRDPRAVAALTEQLRDENAWVRFESARALSEIGDQAALPALQWMAESDTELPVRDMARAAVEKILLQRR